MKKQYIFIILISLILYISYLIISFTYKEYKINSHIEYISNLNQEIKKKIEEAEKIIVYKSSKAYRNKILKEQQSYKNKWEEVIFITTEKNYNKFTIEKIEENIIEKENNKNYKYDEKTIFEKWILLIIKKDINFF